MKNGHGTVAIGTLCFLAAAASACGSAGAPEPETAAPRRIAEPPAVPAEGNGRGGEQPPDSTGPSSTVPAEHRALANGEVCFSEVVGQRSEAGDRERLIVLCYRHDEPPATVRALAGQGTPTSPMRDTSVAVVHAISEPSPVTLVGDAGVCVSRTTERIFVWNDQGALEGFMVEAAPCFDQVDVWRLPYAVGGSHPGARFGAIPIDRRPSRAARAYVRAAVASGAIEEYAPRVVFGGQVPRVGLRLVGWVYEPTAEERAQIEEDGGGGGFDMAGFALFVGSLSTRLDWTVGEAGMLEVDGRTLLAINFSGGSSNAVNRSLFEFVAGDAETGAPPAVVPRVTRCEETPASYTSEGCGFLEGPHAAPIPFTEGGALHRRRWAPDALDEPEAE